MAARHHLQIAILFLLAAVVSVAVRLYTAGIGDNYDMESWWLVSEAVFRGEPVYSATHRYNYGPLWAYLIGACRHASAFTGPDTMARLHAFMTGLLSITDIALALLVFQHAPFAGLLFLFNPVSILVSGYHIQFDNLAILLSLASWILLINGSSWRHTLIAALLLGGSLSMKHIFSIFLAWLPFITTVTPLLHRVVYGAVGLGIFFASFTPWIDNQAAWSGIQSNVFGYISTEGHSLTSALSHLTPGVPARTLFMALVAFAAPLLMRRVALHRAAPLLYLLCLTALSSGMARNYLAIPLASAFFFITARCSALYVAVATVALVTVNVGLGTAEVAFPLLHSELVSYELLQCILLALLLEISVSLTLCRRASAAFSKRTY